MPSTPALQVRSSPPQSLGEGTPRAPCRQVGLYHQACALGGCAPDHVIAVVVSCWGPCVDLGTTAVASACSLCQDRVSPSCQDCVSPPQACAIREHRWRHIDHPLFECRGVPSLGGSLAATLLRAVILRPCSGLDPARAVLLATFPPDRTPAVAATACIVPFLLEPAAAPGRQPPQRMKVQRLALGGVYFCLVCRRRRAPACLRPHACWRTSAFLLGRPSTCGCSAACRSVLCVVRRCSLRLILFGTCPPLCAGALCLMPAWVW